MKQNTSCREFDFTLVLTGVTGITAAIEDALFEAGCDDATLAAKSGRLFLTFSRTALSMKDAILSAIKDVRTAKVGASVLRVDYCDLVNLSDIARRIQRSRQLVHQYMNGNRGPGGFPPPSCEITDGSPLWFWCEVANWLWQNDMIKENVLRDAEEVGVINAVLELENLRKVHSELTAEVIRTVGAPMDV